VKKNKEMQSELPKELAKTKEIEFGLENYVVTSFIEKESVKNCSR
jgi:hypothetical protein